MSFHPDHPYRRRRCASGDFWRAVAASVLATLRPWLTLTIAQDPTADRVLSEDPFALLTGMLLDQQFPMERAFAGPAKVLERFGTLDPAAIADGRPRGLRRPVRHPAGDPPLRPLDGGPHPGAGRRRARHLRRRRLRPSGATRPPAPSSSTRLKALPGFGEQKARIFTALLGKQLGVRPEGWQEACGAYAEPGSYRSVADVVDAESLQKVRDFKKAAKAAARPRPEP